ncbi:type II toxin-antitoxin system MqsR family toxin [Secundilactobacillus mixtipabuli]|uniref:Uncharacterized protein n=1 Tax=Secundilactobacillus mixtipabuli TaxID=1435342 RepID=A0A1Z5IF48_9LACO|nr:type II toxin-antitoxin system MqsR family toxin [Secundilactobacillus mixtipabuli]GAX00071.1 hypothetical protein IWT30_02051 [Secundilactobacillus mixtipabuli]
MNEIEALTLVKYLVSINHFTLTKRRQLAAYPVTNALAKVIINQLSADDFVRYDADRSTKYAGEFVWIFETDFEEIYYIKFKFTDHNKHVKFISFHPSKYH